MEANEALELVGQLGKLLQEECSPFSIDGAKEKQLEAAIHLIQDHLVEGIKIELDLNCHRV